VTLMRKLCGVHTEFGGPYNAGLGFYAYLRFHIDSTKFRRWNMDPAVAAECPPIVHPEDIASVGQPIPAAAGTAPATAASGTAVPASAAPAATVSTSVPLQGSASAATPAPATTTPAVVAQPAVTAPAPSPERGQLQQH
jgi:hypothetical protein